MTHIDNLHINGFKAIKNLDLDAKMVNLITGRNNTGKTSALQSADIVFNPQNITHFSRNLDKVVHEENNTGIIKLGFSKRQQRLDSWNTDGDDERNSVVELRQPTDNEVIQNFSKVIEEILDLNERYPVRRGRRGRDNADFLGIESEESYRNLLQDTLQETAAEISEEAILSNMAEDFIVLSIDGDEYPFVHLGSGFQDIRSIIVEQSIERLRSRVDQELGNNVEQEEFPNRSKFNFDLSSMLAPRFGGDRFIGEKPSGTDGLSLVRKPLLERDDINLDKENTAIRTNDIEDYLKQNNVVDNLRDFSFGRLVFGSESEKDEVPYEFMGDGFKTVVGILWELFDEEYTGNVLLLEEPDIHMHPGYVEMLIRQLLEISKNRDIQLFITSHNLDMINGFFSDQLEKQHGDFLRDNFQLIQLSGMIPKMLDYPEAKVEAEFIESDLRGI